jgi:hypothetical protein
MILTVSNQNYAGSGHLAYYWSPDWGDTWIGHPDNPIIGPGQFPDGVPSDGFQRTPTLLIDEDNNRYIIAYNAGHDIAQKWKRRTYLAIASRPPYLCGDANSDEIVNISDAVAIINHIFAGGNPPDPLEVGDVNCDGTCNVSDAVWIINYVFVGGNEPCDTDGDMIPNC